MTNYNLDAGTAYFRTEVQPLQGILGAPWTGREIYIGEEYRVVKEWLDTSPPEFFDTRRSQAELFFRRIGITFAVYGDNQSTERLIPFDIIPRVLNAGEWKRLSVGLTQRVYDAAVAERYLWHEFGDSALLLPD